MAGFSGRLPLTEPLASGGEMGFGVVFFERLRGSMAMVRRGDLRGETPPAAGIMYYSAATRETFCRGSNISSRER